MVYEADLCFPLDEVVVIAAGTPKSNVEVNELDVRVPTGDPNFRTDFGRLRSAATSFASHGAPKTCSERTHRNSIQSDVGAVELHWHSQFEIRVARGNVMSCV
ncbi:MAG: hypothetical protein JWM85_2326 [Acidimicrobiaceae bacterium]|nr:hypothetical protein [Acidimicrobiaceae bacterium]